jgi:tryptophan-rich sensory protein
VEFHLPAFHVDCGNAVLPATRIPGDGRIGFLAHRTMARMGVAAVGIRPRGCYGLGTGHRPYTEGRVVLASDPAKAAITDVPDHLPLFFRSLLLPTLASAVGFVATVKSVRDWYPTLEKPSWNPPSGVFGPVWTTLYLLMGIADYIVATRDGEAGVTNARRIYRIQLALNTAWSGLFFGLRKPGWALIDIVLLWVAIGMTIAAFWRISRIAALLLVPYFLWTTFATVLNASIWQKNR